MARRQGTLRSGGGQLSIVLRSCNCPPPGLLYGLDLARIAPLLTQPLDLRTVEGMSVTEVSMLRDALVLDGAAFELSVDLPDRGQPFILTAADLILQGAGDRFGKNI